MSAPNPETRLVMAQALAGAFWEMAELPKRWADHKADERTVWLRMADVAFETGRAIKAGSIGKPQLREIAA